MDFVLSGFCPTSNYRPLAIDFFGVTCQLFDGHVRVCWDILVQLQAIKLLKSDTFCIDIFMGCRHQIYGSEVEQLLETVGY